MNAILRHLTIRLWVTVLTGGVLLMALMPYWQRMMGMTWVLPLVLAVMAGCFFCAGWLMNHWGQSRIRHQIAEATVWERAGMTEQAEAAFERVKSIYDSFWLSPLRRRGTAYLITRRLARFYLAQPALNDSGWYLVSAYLGMHPADADVAQGWLEQLMCRETHGRREHALAERISNALADHPKIQRRLMPFLLNSGRSDFEALQVYRRVWQQVEALPDEWVLALSRLLLNENHLNDWALQVYLRGYALGNRHCLNAIASADALLQRNAENRSDLEAAGIVLSALDETRRRKLALPKTAFQLPAAAPAGEVVNETETKSPFLSTVPLVLQRVATLGRDIGLWVGTTLRQAWALGRRLGRSPGLQQVAGTALVLITVAVVVAVGWYTFGNRPVPPPLPEPVVEIPAAPPVIDPFTIQVAAYLRPEDAQRYVDRLRQQAVDAFWTKAASGNRTWYQVKVSHFPSRDEARRYGELLKTKGLIDDFYVANYTP